MLFSNLLMYITPHPKKSDETLKIELRLKKNIRKLKSFQNLSLTNKGN